MASINPEVLREQIDYLVDHSERCKETFYCADCGRLQALWRIATVAFSEDVFEEHRTKNRLMRKANAQP